ncbi:MAG: AMP-binding protein [Anaerolineae bacterium]|jgi:acyl-CoA synthetase (AMP-forming)/AMP-acid ligase II|nr:AMP-binding protein [Anaerolineae bacterium]
MLIPATRIQYRTLLDAAFLRAPATDQPAVIYVATGQPDVVISREELHGRVMLYAAAFQTGGLRPRDLVMIADTGSVDSLYAFWGAMLTGAIPSMFPALTEKLDPDIYMHNLAELVRVSGVKAIFTGDAFAPQLAPRVSCTVLSLQSLMQTLEWADNTFYPYPPAPNDTAFLQHSSGTTGLQKGVALTHEAVLNHLASYSESIALSRDDVVVSWLPLYHDMGLIAGFLLPLVQGVPLVLMSPFDWVTHPALLLRAIQQHRGTLCWLPNFAYNHLARRIRARDSEGLSLAGMRAFINCSEPVRHDSHRLFLERFAANGVSEEMLAVSYAMAENTFAVTQTRIGAAPRLDVVLRHSLEQEQKAQPAHSSLYDGKRQTQEVVSPLAQVTLVSCGAPIAGVQVKIVDAAGATLPERQVGEIVIRSDSLLKGYYRRDDLKALDAEGWYATGDRGYLAGGDVFVIGRSKDLIIHAGKNVYPQDIEAILNTVSGIHPGRAVVFGVPDDKEGTELIAAVAEVDSTDDDARRQLQQAARLAVASQSEVSLHYLTLVTAGWLIKTSSGKIARSQNRDKWLHERDHPAGPPPAPAPPEA